MSCAASAARATTTGLAAAPVFIYMMSGAAVAAKPPQTRNAAYRPVLFPLSPRIVVIYPVWRGYVFILVRGKYIILRPDNHEIVYIIEG